MKTTYVLKEIRNQWETDYPDFIKDKDLNKTDNINEAYEFKSLEEVSKFLGRVSGKFQLITLVM
jgi:hypothetical protein